MRPSFLSAGFSGIFILFALCRFFKNLYFGINDYDSSILIITLLLFATAIGIHSISHSIEEIYYDFNPLVGKWQIHDESKKNYKL